MTYLIKKGAPRTMYIFILTGVFLIIAFGYKSYNSLADDQFITEFPGDWDKPLGIVIGFFLLIRSTSFIPKARKLFISITPDKIVYRTKNTDAIRTVLLPDIKKTHATADTVFFKTNNKKTHAIDLSQVREEERKKAIRNSLLEAGNRK